ncbi:MAG TPA: NAD+ synthase [Acidobacteriaceae bacterium]|nr:NAD+ synthase [Acidobacteriaceae bacterium]
MKIALAQIDPTVADFRGNTARILQNVREAERRGADLVVFPELCVCGYPTGDFVEKPSFVKLAGEAAAEIAREATAGKSISVICGTLVPSPAGAGKRVSNAAVLMQHGEITFTQRKMLLPFYDVFDEQRYFAPADHQEVVKIGNELVALTICEDAWNDKGYWKQRLYKVDPVEEQVRQGATLILNISSSPFWQGKREQRAEMLAAAARHHNLPILMVNQTGGNDSLIFDGTSLALNARGQTMAQGRSFAEDMVMVDTATGTGDLHRTVEGDDAATYAALVMGTRDYIRKCGFKQALIGLSGGIDSALVAAIAVDALGKENVIGVGMPSPYSSQGSLDDSRALASNLGIPYETIRIDGIFSQFTEALAPLFAGRAPDVTEENIQSRIRGTLLMALSNKLGALVLTTGNKSEMAVGYCTLYGDMVGALAVIGDLVKTRVYALSRYVNREREVIPRAILEKAPSAELRPGQLDTDSLPPYEVLDPLVEAYVERYMPMQAIADQQGLDLALVQKIVRLIEQSEYKRQQAAPVLKVTGKSFGGGRRFPIAVKVQV